MKKAPLKHRVLRHIARYRLTIRPVLDRKFFHGTHDGSHNVLNDLLRERFITTHPLGKHSYYQITPDGALEVGLPVTKAKSIGSELRKHLAVLWYCNMSRPTRELVTRDQLREYFPNTTLLAAHCIEPTKAGKPHCLYRVRLAGPNVSDWSLVKSLREYIIEASDLNSELRPLLLRRLYGFVVLCHSKPRMSNLKKLIQQKGLASIPDGRKYRRLALQFAPVPGPETLGVAIHELTQRQKSK